MANGAVWVFTGLTDAMDDNEMAIVLGHELTHYTHEHIRRSQSRSTLAQILGVGTAVAASQIKNPTAQQVAALGGQLGLSALMSGYSREFEDQADRVGLRYVYQAGYVRLGYPGSGASSRRSTVRRTRSPISLPATTRVPPNASRTSTVN